ncbi:MAG: ACT domain-containing protein [Clostridiales bacterium]|nr:ACT domain-containing protein [Clostridiales bacterium]
MRAVITVIGKDKVGILASVSALCSEYNVNILEVSQSIMHELFCMIMLADVSKCSSEFSVFAKACVEAGEKSNLDIRVMHEDIFDSMHRI